MLAPFERVHRRCALLLALAIALMLSACSAESLSRQRPAPSQTPHPTIAPSPRPRILSSDELYPAADSAAGETSRSYASLPPGAVLPPAPSGESAFGVRVVLDARTVLRGNLFQSGSQLAPGILILGADLGAWGSLPAQLAEAGNIVLALETTPTSQARQIEAMLQSLIAIPSVDAGSLGVLGAAEAADLALLGCAVNSLCDALALLSPLSRDTLLNMLPTYGARPLLLMASRADSAAFETALALRRSALGEAELLEAEAGRGAAMLQAQPALSRYIQEWFQQQLTNR